MLKFLRKYNKWILVIGGSLLMVVFLLPQALQRTPGDVRARVVARFDGGEITAGERYRANAELGLLRLVMPQEVEAIGLADPDHWILLKHEARRGGFVGGPETGRRFFFEYVRARGGDPEASYAAAMDIASPRLSQREALQALATFRGVGEMLFAYIRGPRVSDLELMREARSALLQVGVNIAFFPAERLLERVPERPDEQALRAFYEQRSDRTGGRGVEGFGYRRDAAVKFGYITIDPASIRSSLSVDPIEVNTRWRQNRDEYPGEFGEEREAVEQDLIEQETRRVVSAMQNFIEAEIRKSEAALESDGRFKDVPENWREAAPTLAQIAGAVGERAAELTGGEVDPPAVRYETADWMTRPAIRQATTIGRAWLPRGRERVDAPSLLLSVREIEPDTPYALQVGLLYDEPLRDSQGRLFYVRVTDARPVGPPESLDAVREQVVEDWRLSQAYDLLVERFPGYIRANEPDGFAGLVEELGGRLVPRVAANEQRLIPPQGDREYDRALFSRLNRPAVRDAIIERAERIDEGAPPERRPLIERTAWTEMPEMIGVAAAEVLDIREMTERLYVQGVSNAYSSILDERQAVARGADWPFRFDRLRERLAYEPIGRADGEEPETGGADDAQASAQ